MDGPGGSGCPCGAAGPPIPDPLPAHTSVTVRCAACGRLSLVVAAGIVVPVLVDPAADFRAGDAADIGTAARIILGKLLRGAEPAGQAAPPAAPPGLRVRPMTATERLWVEVRQRRRRRFAPGGQPATGRALPVVVPDLAP